MTLPDSTPNTDQPEPPRLRFLRWLVIVMTLTMIVGIVVIVVLMIMTFTGARKRVDTQEPLVDMLTLPTGHQARAYTQGSGWSAVVTRDETGEEYIHIFDPATGEIRQTVTIK